MADLKINTNWILITIDDPNLLTGKSIIEILKLLKTGFQFEFVITNWIEGSGKNGVISSLQKRNNKVMRMNEILTIISDINQLDWGDFFLFKDLPANWNNPRLEPYPHVIAQTDTTVRAVDNQYFYIYTKDEKVVEFIKEHYIIESIKTGNLENLDYPE